jgi:hypothetical protein
MDKLVFRAKSEPTREGLSWDEIWKGLDGGLIRCWETGRARRVANPDLARKVESDELPILGWKGGVENKLVNIVKYGSLNYLAEWQGLRGENLEIDASSETTLICAKTGMKVIFNPDQSRLNKS